MGVFHFKSDYDMGREKRMRQDDDIQIVNLLFARQESGLKKNIISIVLQ